MILALIASVVQIGVQFDARESAALSALGVRVVAAGDVQSARARIVVAGLVDAPCEPAADAENRALFEPLVALWPVRTTDAWDEPRLGPRAWEEDLADHGLRFDPPELVLRADPGTSRAVARFRVRRDPAVRAGRDASVRIAGACGLHAEPLERALDAEGSAPFDVALDLHGRQSLANLALLLSTDVGREMWLPLRLDVSDPPFRIVPREVAAIDPGAETRLVLSTARGAVEAGDVLRAPACIEPLGSAPSGSGFELRVRAREICARRHACRPLVVVLRLRGDPEPYQASVPVRHASHVRTRDGEEIVYLVAAPGERVVLEARAESPPRALYPDRLPTLASNAVGATWRAPTQPGPFDVRLGPLDGGVRLRLIGVVRPHDARALDAWTTAQR